MCSNSILKELIKLACRSGASDAGEIPATAISVEERLAKMCRSPQCKHYGLSAGCPPHVSGPSGMREMLKHYSHALVFKIDVPAGILLSHEGPDFFKLLHEIATAVEHAAAEMDCADAKAFASGGCKKLFCPEYDVCSVLEGSECRNPHKARPSMSGFGIDVNALMQAAGWNMLRTDNDVTRDQDSVMPICGLILVC